jgi:3-deoxy-D-manno-octulosonic-acid transferase
MAQSLGLSAYRAVVRRNPPTPYKSDQDRPLGEVLWLHAPSASNALAMLDIAKRISDQRDGVSVLITSDTLIASPDPNIRCAVTPSEHPHDVIAFLEHWQPDVALWLWGEIRPNLILATHDRKVPMIMADASQEGFESRRDRWLPEVARDVMACFENVLARSEPSFFRLAKLVRNIEVLEQSGPLVAGGQSLSFAQTDFDDLSGVLAGRPVWLAASVRPDEIKTVLAAHRHALRLSHRLLLILNPASEEQAEDCEAQLATEGFRSARWEEGEMPDDNCQVLLATAQDELGLWYRVAPLSFLGCSLTTGQHGLDPFQAAALGTAVLYGPNVRNHMPSYTRLAAAGAARIVNDAGALGVAVARLISPDHAASMAMSGWDVVSQGAAVTDRIVELVIASFDKLEEGAG